MFIMSVHYCRFMYGVWVSFLTFISQDLQFYLTTSSLMFLLPTVQFPSNCNTGTTMHVEIAWAEVIYTSFFIPIQHSYICMVLNICTWHNYDEFSLLLNAWYCMNDLYQDIFLCVWGGVGVGLFSQLKLKLCKEDQYM